MYLKFAKLLPLLLPLLCALTVGLFTPGVYSQTYHPTPVNIFGDGDPNNGIEDNRIPIPRGRRSGISDDDRRMNAGTLKCDGKIRGTAMVINTQEIAPDLNGVVLASAAHVLFDLEEGQLFKRCEFHFLALGKRSRYRAKVDLTQIKMGHYTPSKSTRSAGFGEGDWVFIYIPKPWKAYAPTNALKLRDFSFSQMDSYRKSNGVLSLVAFDSSAGVISVSRDCTVIESSVGDLGGGGWIGQLLDDCDSGGGASGGGIIANLNGEQYLVGIRNGSHWDEQIFPTIDYPNGPPDGSVWDLNSNTNFGRAIDAQLMQVLQQFTLKLEQKESEF